MTPRTRSRERVTTIGGDNPRALSRVDLVEEPRGEIYRALLKWSADRCQTGLVVVRAGNDMDASAIDILNEIGPAITSVETTQQWPGTALLSPEDCAQVYRYQLTSNLLNMLMNAVDGLYEWTEPMRPDDLCFLRGDGSAMLVTIAHERDAYCRRGAPPTDFLTKTQRQYATDALMSEAVVAVDRMIKGALDLGPTGRRSFGGGMLSMELAYKSGGQPEVSRPVEEELRRDVRCPQSGHQVAKPNTACSSVR